MEDDPSKPIIVSEVPPQRQSSARSFLSRLDRSLPALSEGSVHEQRKIGSSPSKSFTQTMIEKWVTITSAQKYEKVDDALDDSLPPWVSSSRPVQEHNYSIIDSPPAIKSEKNSQGFVDDSEWSLPEVNDMEEYSIPATNSDLPLYSGPDDDLEIYRTPCNELSPTNDPMGPLLTESLPIEILEEEAFIIEPLPEECYVPEVEPKPHNAFRNENNNEDSQAATQYNAQERVRFDSQETVRFDSQETVQFDPQETMSQGSQSRELSTSGNTHKAEAYDLNIFQISTKIDSQEGPNIPDPYTPIFDYRPNSGNSSPTNSSHYENAEDNASPCLLFSPFNDNNSLPHLSPPRVNPVLQFDFFEDLLSIPVKETKLDEPDISTTRKHYLQDDSGIGSSSRSKTATKFQRLNTDEPAVITDTKKEKGKQKESSSGRSVESQEPIKLVRPEKRQVRSSVLKTDKTIETYFSNSLGTSQEEGELDIGREAVPPSYYSADTGLKKEDKHVKKEAVVDQRRRSRFGLSKIIHE